MKKPDLFKTSLIFIISTILSTVVSTYGMFMYINMIWLVIYGFVFTLIWLLPSFFSTLLLRLSRVKISPVVHMESALISFFPLFTFLTAYFVGATLKYTVFSNPKDTVYSYLIYRGAWKLPVAMFFIGFLWSFIYMVYSTHKVAKIRVIYSFFLWIFAWMLSIYPIYLVVRCWL